MAGVIVAFPLKLSVKEVKGIKSCSYQGKIRKTHKTCVRRLGANAYKIAVPCG